MVSQGSLLKMNKSSRVLNLFIKLEEKLTFHCISLYLYLSLSLSMPPISATGARGGCSTVASTLVRRQAAQSST